MNDARSNLEIRKGMPPLNYNSGQDGAASSVIDLAPWKDAAAAFEVYTHVTTGGAVSLQLEHADAEAGPFTAVPGMAHNLPAVTATETIQSWVFAARDVKQFVRAVVNVPSNSSAVFSMAWVLSGPTANRPSSEAASWTLDGATDISS